MPMLFNCGQFVADWAWRTFKLMPMHVNLAIGTIDGDGQITGAVLYQGYNGNNIEVSYYGPGTATLGIIRGIAQIALHHFCVQRLTIRTQRTNAEVIRGARKLGFAIEGSERHFYGPDLDAIRMVLFRDGLQRLAGENNGHVINDGRRPRVGGGAAEPCRAAS